MTKSRPCLISYVSNVLLWVFAEGLVAGGIAGVVVEAALYPIDTIKTRLQAGCSWWRKNCIEGSLFWIGRKSCWCLTVRTDMPFLIFVDSLPAHCFFASSLFQCGLSVMLVIQFSGISSVQHDLKQKEMGQCVPNVVSFHGCFQQKEVTFGRASAIFVGVYEPTKQKLLKTIPENLSAFAHLVSFVTKQVSTYFIQTAGAVGGAASSLVRVPTEVVKQRMQTGQFASATDAVQLILPRRGLKVFMRLQGYGSFLLRDLPFDALQFCIYEQLRIGYKLAAQRDLNDPENAMIGAFSGAITGAITTPLDVIKTRLMVQGSANQYKGIFDCVRTVIREEGTPALFKGIGPRVLWIGIGGSIFFVILERTKQVVAQTHTRTEK
ncbi:putative S-adenosylmethionine carrier 2, chloroplastic [Vitis vinifera]|uniref:Putative S-adenosylmethionine carrier 2, chloroplastic n=1 Tax=Vitis vinifera TaxID=29760 RepID=A0A438IDS3_VITVI|nr:putative S-adenosylmethionine carrier 2, chloroplastic [Vitis vinifera]